MKAPPLPLGIRGLVAVCVALSFAALPHWLRLPVWVPLLCLACIGWRLAAARHHWRPAPGFLRIGLTLLAVFTIWGHFGTVFGRDAGVALLTLMLSMKLLEVHRLRDAFLVGMVCYFLIATEFLFSQTILRGLYMSVAVLVVTVSLILLQDAQQKIRLAPAFRQAGTLLLQAMPLMAVMFLLFPRLASPLWGTPELDSAKTGLSDEMSPGSISNLYADDSVAFRVAFSGSIPETRELYWRGPVLWNYDGEVWTRGRVPWNLEPSLERTGEIIHYRVMLEPHHRHWLFALSMPLQVPDGAVLTGDFEMVRRRPVDELISYEMSSARSYVDSADLPEPVRRAGLQWPDGFNGRTRELGRRWAHEFEDRNAVVARALAYFRDQPFEYTLTPAPLGRQAMDDFLFATREGYCEHYASAFVLLMRAAGIPARVATGYLGGTVNPIGDYLLVLQSDAHAWAEVWLGDRGWVAVDPTGALDPARVQVAGAGLLGGSDELGWIGRVTLTWDAMQNLWNNWLLSYDHDSQNRLFDRLEGKGPKWQTGAAWLAVAGIATLAVGALWSVIRGRRPAGDPAVREWARFRRKLLRAGIEASPTLGPHALAARAARVLSGQAGRIARIRDSYVALRYRRHSRADSLRLLRLEVKRLRVKERGMRPVVQQG